MFLWRLGSNMFRITDHTGRCRADFAKHIAPRFFCLHESRGAGGLTVLIIAGIVVLLIAAVVPGGRFCHRHQPKMSINHKCAIISTIALIFNVLNLKTAHASGFLSPLGVR